MVGSCSKTKFPKQRTSPPLFFPKPERLEGSKESAAAKSKDGLVQWKRYPERLSMAQANATPSTPWLPEPQCFKVNEAEMPCGHVVQQQGNDGKFTTYTYIYIYIYSIHALLYTRVQSKCGVRTCMQYTKETSHRIIIMHYSYSIYIYKFKYYIYSHIQYMIIYIKY